MKTQTRANRLVAFSLALVVLSPSLPAFAEAPAQSSAPAATTTPAAPASDNPDATSGASLSEDAAAPAPAATPADANPDATSGASLDVGTPDAVSGATPGGGKPFQPNLFGLNVSLSSHRIAGYASGGLLLAAGAMGMWRFLDLQDQGHDFRDEEDAVSGASLSGKESECVAAIHDAWANDQTLRALHVGFVISGESLYLYDAATGISLMAKNKTPTLTGKIHRTAFFAHAGLMVADIVTGFLLTSALDRGNHDQVVGLGATHAAIGVAIPLVILGSGVAVDVMERNR